MTAIPVPAPDVSAHWYEVVDGQSLRQGDIFQNIRIPLWWQDMALLPTGQGAEETPVDLKRKVGTWIILTASCDMANEPPVEYIILGSVVNAVEVTAIKTKEKEKRQLLEMLRRGAVSSKFLLSGSNAIDPPFPVSVVDFRWQTCLPTAFVRRLCSERRLRMKPPFREWLGQWVGTNFSRVGVEDAHQLPRDPAGTSPSLLLEMLQADGR